LLFAFALGVQKPGSDPGSPPQEKKPVKVDWRSPRSLVSKEGGAGTEAALRSALTWLVNHQNDAGYWSGAKFTDECARLGDELCEGVGQSTYDVGLTGLCLLALTGADAAASRGGFSEEIERAVEWLLAQQDSRRLIGVHRFHDFFYSHLIATYALCEAYERIPSDEGKKRVRDAVKYIIDAGNPEGGWRYEVPSAGDSDTSITAWALVTLGTAQKRGILDTQWAIDAGFKWIDEATDGSKSGRIGYNSRGSLSARTPDNQHFPREDTEAMTAAGLWARYFVDRIEGQTELVEKQVALIQACPPKETAFDPDGETYLGNDVYYCYHATYAMFQKGAKAWKSWNRNMKKVALETQVKRGPAKGSWNPDGPWGHVGGRVYQTALMALCLEVYFRYPRFSK